MLSDEVSSDSESSDINERPGNAQFVESNCLPLVDFNGVSAEVLFGKRTEVYCLNADKLQGLVECNLCRLIFDYTKICKHSDTLINTEELKFENIQTVLD